MKAGKDFIGIGIGVIIFNSKNQVLLGLRNTDSAKADSELKGEGTWTLPGGKLEFKETLFQCAKREVKEETSLEVDNFELVSVANDIKDDIHFVTIGFLAKEHKGEPKVMEPDEITEWDWFDLDNMPKNMFFPSAKLIENFKSKKIYNDN